MPSIDTIIDRELRRWELERTRGHGARPSPATPTPPTAHRFVTVSRQHGSAGTEIARRVAERLGHTLLDREAIQRMCESAGTASRLLAALDEHTRSQLDIWTESMVSGRYVDSSDYLRALVRTIYSLAELGGVVVVGRGANFIVGAARGFHVRVVAPRAERARAVMRRRGGSLAEAQREVRRVDSERERFVRDMFGRSIEDPLGYDLVVNSADAPPEVLSAWLAEAARAKFEWLASRADTAAAAS